MLILLAISTLLAEDLTCLAAGALVATGQVSFVAATLACLIGIVAGDLGLYGLGRFAGRRLLGWTFLRSRVTAEQLDRAGEWLSRRGAAVVFVSRFTPGMRLPVYVAAGALRTDALKFATLFTIASAIWTPLLVGLAVLVERHQAQSGLSRLPVLLPVALTLLCARVLIKWENRRRLRGFVSKLFRWEFWPMWAAYLPVVPWILLLAVRFRCLTLFSAANPGIYSGGFAGESKADILTALMPSGAVAPFVVIRPGDIPVTPARWPVVLKPDIGERGEGVAIVRSENELLSYLSRAQRDTIVQEYVPGLEFGILYCRRPHERAGRIVSITEKRFPVVTGDGRRTLKELILADNRAVCLAPVYLERNAFRKNGVPTEGERIRLVEIGSHCRGAIFLDARQFCTAQLAAKVDAISKSYDEFYLGRYDVRTPSVEHLQRGEFTVIELNGVAGEPIHIYDPAVGLLDAYRAMYRHWQLAFEIGDVNRSRGYRPMTFAELWRTVRSRRRRVPAPAHSSEIAAATSRL